MKKSNLLLAILCLTLGFVLAACSDDDEEKKDTGVKKEAGVDMPVKKPDMAPDKKVTQPDKGTDGVVTPDLGADGVTTPDMSADSALPDMLVLPDMPKVTCSFPFKYITLKGGKGSVQGEIKSTDKTSNINLAATNCTKKKTPGAEHIYAVYLASSAKYYIQVTPASGYNTAVYVFTDCGKVAPTCIAGADANYSGSAEAVTFTPPVTGVYFIGVDSSYNPGATYSYGKYTVNVMEAKTPKNDTCAGAATLTFPTGKTKVSATGNTQFAKGTINLTSSGCTKKDTEGPDLFYAVSLKAGQKYSFSASPMSGYDVSLYLMSACGASSCVAGADSSSSGSTESFTYTPKTAGTYYIGVDTSYAATSSYAKGSFTLDVAEFHPAKNDTCKTAEKVTLVGGKAKITGKKGLNASDTLKKCGTTTLSATDLFYKFSAVKGQMYRVTFKPTGSGGRFGVWQGSHNCVASAVETACGTLGSQFVSGSSSGSLIIKADGTDIYFAADGLGTTYNVYDFTFEIDEVVAPTNDTCVKASKMTFSSGKASVKGDTSLGTNTYNLPKTGCTKNDTEGKDVFFSADLKAGQAYKIKLTPGSGFDAALYVLSQCASTACEAGVDSAYSGSAESMTFIPTKTGTYYIGVDSSYAVSSSSGYGTFTLDIEEYNPPKGDSCAKPNPITLTGTSATVSGDTSSSSNSVALSYSDCAGASSPGQDTFYSVTLTGGKAYKVTLTPASGFDAMVYAFTSCSAPASSCVAGKDTIGSGAASSIKINPTTTSTYYIGVDSYSSTEKGKFTLKIEEAAPPPANSKCAGAKTFPMPGGKGTITGDTSNALNEYAGTVSCHSSYTFYQGPQLYYKVLMKKGLNYKFELTPTFASYMYLFPMAACGSATKISTACKTGSKTGVYKYVSSSSSGSIVFSPPYDAWMVLAVDSTTAGTGGKFTLSASIIKKATNDTCTTATPITLTAGKGKVSGDTTGATDTSAGTVKCGAYGTFVGKDVYYSLNLSSTKTYLISLSPKFTSYLYVFRKSSCGTPAKIQVDCASKGLDGDYKGAIYSSSGGFIKFKPVKSGAYVIAVDSSSATTFGSFDLSVEELTPAANDTCNKATPITLTGGKGKASGNTMTATNTTGTTVKCGNTSAFSGADVFYSVNLKSGQAYSIGLSPKFTGYVYVFRKTSCGTLGMVQSDCASSGLSGDYKGSISSGSTGYVKFKPTTGGDYIIAVDATSSSYAGSFDLTVDEFKAAANDTCATAQKVTLVGGKATVTGTKGPTASNWLKKCGTAAMDATDLFYKFTPVKGKTYDITFKPVGGGRFGVWDGSHSCVNSAVVTACGVLGYKFVSTSDTTTITAKSGDIYFVADGLSNLYDNYKFTFEIVQK